jgi:hypothetical protein
MAMRMSDFATKYAAHFLGAGCVAFIAFLVGIATALAANDERDNSQDGRLDSQDHQIELLRRENREDHKRIEERLDLLLRQASGADAKTVARK